MKSIRRTSGFAIVAALALACSLWAQSDRGTITGTVLDQSGAVMAGVTVTATNTETGVATQATSGPGGAYTIPFLHVGKYDVVAEMQGFKKFLQSGLVLEVGQTVALNIHMQIGSVNQTVQVTAQPLLDSDNSTKDTVVTSRDVEELPIVSQSEIRNPGFYINLAPGVVSRGTVTPTASGSGRQLDSTVNGSPSGAVEFFLDGMQIGQGGMMTGEFGDLPFPPDSVGEFRVMTLLPEAELGETALGVVSFAMKSGTNQIHGEGYEYVRNNALDSCGFFACEAVGSKTPVNKQNEFGANVGGPVVLPHIYNGRDKTFFFGWYHAFRLRNEPSNALDTVPTVAMQGGNLSNLGQTPIADCGAAGNQQCFDAIGRAMYENEAYDPATTRTVAAGAADPETGLTNTSGATAILRDGFGYSPTTGLPTASANIIPSSRIDPLAAKMFTYFPQSGMRAGTEFGYIDNWLASYTALTNTSEWGAKMDHNISSRNRIMGEFAWSNEYNPSGSKWPGAITNGGTSYTQQDIARFSDDFIFSPTVVNHLGVGFNRLGTMSYPGAGTGWPAKLGYSGVPQTGPGSVFVELSIGDLGNLYATQGQSYGATNVFNVSDNLNWVKGKNSFKFGGSYTKFQVNAWSASYQSSFLTFDEGTTSLPGPSTWYNDSCPAGGECTGMGEAGFLLGDVSTGTAGITGVTGADRYAYYGFFGQDDYKFSRRLTLNLGLRYDIFRPDVDAHNALSWVSPFAMNTQYGIRGAMVFASNGQRSPVSASLGDLGPRIGLAYMLNDKTVIRSGYGILYTAGGIERALSGTSGGGRLGYNASNALPENVVSGYSGLTPVFQLSSGWPSSKFPLPPFINQSYEVGQGPFFEGFPGDNKVPSIQNWTFDVQREIPGRMVVDVAYVGTKGTHIPSRLMNSNVMPTEYTNAFTYAQSTSPYTPGNYLFSAIGTPAVQALPIVQAMPVDPTTGNHSPFTGFESVWGSSATLGQALRPFPQYTTDTTEGLSQMRDFGEGVGNSIYNALQVQVRKQFSEGLTFLASYTWEKTMTDAGSLFNEFSGFTQDFYNARAERSLALNDYPQTLTLSYEYQLPFGPGKRFATQGGAAGRIVGGWEIAAFQTYQSGPPSIIASGDNPLNPYSGPNSFLTRPNIVPGVPKRSVAFREGKWDPNGTVVNGVDYGAVNNVAAWTDPSSNTLDPWTLGNAPATDGTVRGFGWLDEDVSIIKKTKVKERVNVEFRADFLNIFNRTVFGFDQGGDQYGSILQGNEVSSGLGGFGHITTQENFPREIQFGLKITY